MDVLNFAEFDDKPLHTKNDPERRRSVNLFAYITINLLL